MFKTVISAETIAKSGVFTSKPFTFPKGASAFSLYWVVTGDGTCKFEWLESVDGVNFVHNDGQDIAASQTKTTGPGSDGEDMVDFAPNPCEVIKIVCTETGTANTVTVTAKVAVEE